MAEAAATGRCLCGAVRFSARGEPLARTLCHCVSCRRATGGVSVAWAVFAATDVSVDGAIREYSSSPGIFWGSCEGCGSLVTYRRDTRPTHLDLTTATFEEPERFPPTVEIWTGERIAWEQLNPALPHKLRSTLNE